MSSCQQVRRIPGPPVESSPRLLLETRQINVQRLETTWVAHGEISPNHANKINSVDQLGSHGSVDSGSTKSWRWW